jgi:hypothetical protein
MLDTLTFSELEAQEVELLPARTVLSLIRMGGSGGGSGGGGGGGGGGGHMGGGGSGGGTVGCDSGTIIVSINECNTGTGSGLLSILNN